MIIVDYGLGNTGSILNAFKKIGADASVSGDAEEISNTDGVIFPGDGAAGQAMKNLKNRKLIEPLKDYISGGRPFLGICLGMQILLTESQEGNTECLDIIQGKVRKFNKKHKIPQIGWNKVEIQDSGYKLQTEKAIRENLFRNIKDSSYFYFINSYYCDPLDRSIILATTDYGEEFCSVFIKENIVGVQFHPEKSGSAGYQFLKNWINLC